LNHVEISLGSRRGQRPRRVVRSDGELFDALVGQQIHIHATLNPGGRRDWPQFSEERGRLHERRIFRHFLLFFPPPSPIIPRLPKKLKGATVRRGFKKKLGKNRAADQQKGAFISEYTQSEKKWCSSVLDV
jgi:hypothetical protein